MKNIISCEQFNINELEEIFSLTDSIIKFPSDFSSLLKGRLIATLFYEPSTRSRLSFEAAALRLGASVLGTENALAASSAYKGESLSDTIRIVAGYADAIVLRHFENDSAVIAQSVSEVPVINAGSGSAEHPTQALLDAYTIYKHKGGLKNLSVLLMGDLKYGRTIHSLLKLLSLYDGLVIYGLSDAELSLPEEYVELLENKKLVYRKINSIFEAPQKIDVIYQTRMQKERFEGENVSKLICTIDNNLLNYFDTETILLHPLPRNQEILPEVDANKRSLYFMQARYGMYVRMALFCKVLEVL